MAFGNAPAAMKMVVFLHGTVIGQAYPATFKRESSKGSGEWVDDGEAWDVNVQVQMADESMPRIVRLRINAPADDGDTIEFPLMTKIDLRSEYKIKTGIVVHGKTKKKEVPKDTTLNQPAKV